MSEAAYKPTVSEIEGSEIPDAPSVKVQVEGPVRTQDLPATSWAVELVQPTDSTGALKLVHADPRRKRVIVMSTSGSFYMAPTQAQANIRLAAHLAQNTSFVFTHRDEIWVNNEPGGAPDISAVVELWTD